MSAVDTQAPARFVLGPGVCGNDLESRAWAGTVVLALPDGRRVGVRSTSRAVLDAVRGIYADFVVGDEGPALYSLVVSEPGRRRASPLHFLHHGGQVVFGTRDLARLVRALVWQASQLLEPEPADLTAVATVLRRSDGRLVVAPPELLAMAGPLDRVLTAAGVRAADAGWVALRRSGATMAVPSPANGPDPDELDLDALRALGPSTQDQVVRAGDGPVAGWLVAARPEDVGPVSGARAVAAVASLLRRPYPQDVTNCLGAVVDAVRRTPVTGVAWEDPDDLAEQVLAAVDRP